MVYSTDGSSFVEDIQRILFTHLRTKDQRSETCGLLPYYYVPCWTTHKGQVGLICKRFPDWLMSRDVVTSDHLITPFIFHDNQQQPPHTWLVLGISTVLFVSPCLCHCPVTSCPATIIWNIILSDQTQTTDSLLLLSPFTTYRSVLQTVSVDVNDQKIVRILSSKRSLSAGNLHHLRWYLSLSLSLCAVYQHFSL